MKASMEGELGDDSYRGGEWGTGSKCPDMLGRGRVGSGVAEENPNYMERSKWRVDDSGGNHKI